MVVHTRSTTAFILIIFITLARNAVSSTKCFKCNFVAQKNYMNSTPTLLCSNFDYSNDYIVDCPYSTMCMKKTYELRLPNNEVIRGTERDCAPQKYEHQQYVAGKWHLRANIEEAYEEGCHIEDDKGARLSPPQYCYCRRYLCNSAPSNNHKELAYHVDAMAVIIVFNALKYFRSFE